VAPRRPKDASLDGVEPPRAKGDRGSEEVRQVLRDLDIPARLRPDLLLEVGDQTLLVEVRTRITESDVRATVTQMRKRAKAAKADGVLLVADRISNSARDILSSSGVGWLDRRGHLRIRGPSLLVDSDIKPLATEPTDRVIDLFSPAGRDVAIALLLAPDEHLGTMEIARRTGRSAGRASELLASMRNAGLVESTGQPLIPDLFDALADEWAPRWYPLAAIPPPASIYRLSGTLGAIWQGAPMVATADWPPEIYVDDRWNLRHVLSSVGLAAEGPAAASVALCPSRYGFSREAEINEDFPVANHVVVALDLAQDPGRGREVLAAWTPQGQIRVW
jgi:hypothetical protein